MTTKTKQLNMRLALRVEGKMWNAYAAEPGTMDRAILLGAILMTAVENSPARKAAFMDLMKDAFGAFIADIIGEEPVWGEPERAPEHERSGRA